MSTLSRRNFLASLAATVPLAVIVRRAHAAAALHVEANPATLNALAQAVLPSAPGPAGTRREATEFLDWARQYPAGGEAVHGYGTSRLRTLGPTPLTRWMTQLDELEQAARSKFQRAFHELTIAQRQELVRAALQGQRIDRMPATADAGHVALALLAHFYESSAANDLCYEAKIGKNTCRPLAQSPRRPLPLLKVSER